MTDGFYDKFAEFYHLIYENWDNSIQKQSADIDAIIRKYSGDEKKEILDVSCGIGTQALGLAKIGHSIIASDISTGEIERVRCEAEKRGLKIDFSIADMRNVFEHHQRRFDVVISCDNSVPHLLTDEDILSALRQFYLCLKPSGVCIITVRDYGGKKRSETEIEMYGIRKVEDDRYFVFQVRDFEGDIYNITMYVVKEKGTGECETHVMKSKYYAVTTDKIIEFMEISGFTDVERLDGCYFQPVIIGKKSQNISS